MKIFFVSRCVILMNLFFDSKENVTSWKINNHLHARYNGLKGIKELLVTETNIDKILIGIIRHSIFLSEH